MSETAFADLTKQILSLSYNQTIILMSKMLESLKSKRIEEDYQKLVAAVIKLISE